jgi:hypothetical protein
MYVVPGFSSPCIAGKSVNVYVCLTQSYAVQSKQLKGACCCPVCFVQAVPSEVQ